MRGGVGYCGDMRCLKFEMFDCSERLEQGMRLPLRRGVLL